MMMANLAGEKSLSIIELDEGRVLGLSRLDKSPIFFSYAQTSTPNRASPAPSRHFHESKGLESTTNETPCSPTDTSIP